MQIEEEGRRSRFLLSFLASSFKEPRLQNQNQPLLDHQKNIRPYSSYKLSVITLVPDIVIPNGGCSPPVTTSTTTTATAARISVAEVFFPIRTRAKSQVYSSQSSSNKRDRECETFSEPQYKRLYSQESCNCHFLKYGILWKQNECNTGCSVPWCRTCPSQCTSISHDGGRAVACGHSNWCRSCDQQATTRIYYNQHNCHTHSSTSGSHEYTWYLHSPLLSTSSPFGIMSQLQSHECQDTNSNLSQYLYMDCMFGNALVVLAIMLGTIGMWCLQTNGSLLYSVQYQGGGIATICRLLWEASWVTNGIGLYWRAVYIHRCIYEYV